MFQIAYLPSLIVLCSHLNMGGVAPNRANVALTGRDDVFLTSTTFFFLNGELQTDGKDNNKEDNLPQKRMTQR